MQIAACLLAADLPRAPAVAQTQPQTVPQGSRLRCRMAAASVPTGPGSAAGTDGDDAPARHATHPILIVTDAWHPQVNGVVRTLSMVAGALRNMGHVVEVIGPDRFRSIPCPTYPGIRIPLLTPGQLGRMIDAIRPGTLHIATEGVLGWFARRWARRRGLPFTTSLHTRFPEYIEARTGIPARIGWMVMRHFHAASSGTMAATPGLLREMEGRGFRHLRQWSRGVDVSRFQPEVRRDWKLPRPVFVSVGRVAVEKNLPAFLDLDLPGSKVVVGDGPGLAALKRRYPSVLFTGALSGAPLAEAFAGADVFVFPSRTDTFGLVLLESMACGTPVAAFPVCGPVDVVVPGTGVLDDDLSVAALGALRLDRAVCRAHAERCSWDDCAQLFLSHLVPLQSYAVPEKHA